MSLGPEDLFPEVRTALPGPRSRAASAPLAELEAPGINTLYGGAPSLSWQEALGSCVLDLDGNRFLDFTSGFGVAAIGHRHPRGGGRDRPSRAAGWCTAWATSWPTPAGSSWPPGCGRWRPFRRPPKTGCRSISRSPAPTPSRSPSKPRCSHARGQGEARPGSRSSSLRTTGSPWVRWPPPRGRPSATLSPPTCTARSTAFLSAQPLGELRRALAERRFSRRCWSSRWSAAKGCCSRPPAGWPSWPRPAARPAPCWSPTRSSPASGVPATSSPRRADGVLPDLVCCGKALGGGLPIAAVLGAARISPGLDHPGRGPAHRDLRGPSTGLRGRARRARGDRRRGAGSPARALRLGEDRPAAGRLGRSPGARGGARPRPAFRARIPLREQAAPFPAWRPGAQASCCWPAAPTGRVAQLVPCLTIGEAQLDFALAALERALEP